MKVNSITRLVLGSILVIFFKPTLLNSALSLSDERVDRPQTARGKHLGKLLVRDSFTNTPDLTRQRSVPVLRIRGQAPARIPPGQDYLPEFNRLPDVSVTCSSKGFVLRVKKSFYGFSAVAEELTLGETCKSNGVLEPHEDLLFTYALTDCQGQQQVVPDYVVYKYVLHYVPLLHRNPFIYHRVNVGVECRHKRNHHVHSLMINPTLRTPLRKVIRSRSGDFRIQLMDDSWSSPVRSAVYLLGQNVNVQISTRHHYPGVKLFINSCYVATVNTLSPATKYSIIDNYGCLQESRINPGASRFRLSRADNVVQFSFGAFQFIEAPDAQVSLHCEVSMSGGGPSPMQKSCFYRHPDKRWISVFGQDSVCDCCDSVCNQTKTKRIIYEGFISSDQVLFSDTSMASSTLNSTLRANRNDDTIWFEAKLAKEPQRSYTHEDFVASVTLISSEEAHDKLFRTSTVELIEEERKEMEEEKHGDVEILILSVKALWDLKGRI
ncbi:zona pellucida sperm-binding protein 3 isoform X2 [Ctenopharyngodon idella]|uniref:zona pellucida sperm-binding protein 3 isoform X2 n=1 Tax=Ctenopharyngodon idella TaxID=7959 RepID=UPI002231BB8B|nr:zona pellucida sperm-binding protein 3 isoform X2 [Ctenopharyngodon idella]